MFLGFISTDIIIYRDDFRDNLLKITLYPGFVLIMFSRKTISVGCFNIDSYFLDTVKISH